MRLAALLPRCESAWEALEKAGYSLKTARSSALRTRESAGVRRATEVLERREEAKRDKARAVYARAGDLVSDRLDSARDEIVLAAWKTSADILASGVGTDDTQREWNTPSWYRAQLRRAFLRVWKLGFNAGCATQDVVLSPATSESHVEK